MSLFPPYDRRASSRRAAHAAVALGGGAPTGAVLPDAADGAAPAARAASDGPAAAGGTCSNCDAARVGEYCAHCGQHFLEDRLTFRVLAAELWERVTFERGMLRTVREMLADPGGVVRRYTQGQRRRYVSPLTYLFVGAALSLLMFELYDDRMADWVRGSSSSLSLRDHPFLTPAQVEVHARATVEMARQTTYTGLALCGLFALFLRLFFRKTGVNLVETFVLALYTFGQVYLLSLPLTATAVLGLDSIALGVYLVFPLYFIVCCLAGAQYFGRPTGRPVRAAVKTGAALVTAYLLFSFVVGTALLVYALLAVREGISAPRTAAAPSAVEAPAAR